MLTGISHRHRHVCATTVAAPLTLSPPPCVCARLIITVRGAWASQSAALVTALRSCVLSSSEAALLCGTNYSAANARLNAHAIARRACGMVANQRWRIVGGVTIDVLVS